jgi:ribosome-associated protein
LNPTPPASPSDASSVADASNEPATVSKPNEALHALILHQLDEDQAADIISIPLAGVSTIADFMVIASGRSSRHVAAIADKISSRIKQEGLGFPRLEGLPTADWVLIDAGDVVVHLFRPEVRSFYNLERMWGGDGANAPATPPSQY